MPPIHIPGISRALYRVFVAPNLRAATPILPVYPTQCPPGLRTKTYTKDTRRHAISDHYVIDSAIEAHRVNLVDEKGTFYPSVPIQDALTSYDRVTHYLVQVAAPKVDEFGYPEPHSLPTCRIMTKIELRAQHHRKLDTERRQARGQSAGISSKSLELGWAIAQGDLKHRIAQLNGFLKEGRKVEVLLAPKKKGRIATPDEATALVKAVREAVDESGYGREVKAEGNVGGVLTIVFQGNAVEKKKKDRRERDEEESNHSDDQMA